MNERKAEALYNRALEEIMIPLVGNATTISSDLTIAGKKLFGVKYAGTFSADRIPPLEGRTKYVILNLDEHGEPGSHWIAVAKDNSHVWVYDSYGRPTQTILPDLGQHFTFFDTDPDVEQTRKEENCGARCLAWLWVFGKYGPDSAKLI